jgi:hypothetical protein
MCNDMDRAEMKAAARHCKSARMTRRVIMSSMADSASSTGLESACRWTDSIPLRAGFRWSEARKQFGASEQTGH